MATLTAVTLLGPKRRFSRWLSRLDTTVPTEMIMKITPAKDTGTPSSGTILGQAAPSRPSGRPRLMKAI